MLSTEHIVYLAKYVSSPQRLFEETDRQLFSSYFSRLKKIFPHLHEDQVIDYHLTRSLYTQPFFKTNYSRLKPGFTLPVEGIHMMNISQLFPACRTLNNSLVLAKQFVDSHY